MHEDLGGTELAAGDLGSWVTGMLAAVRRGEGSDVPCGSCTGCCTSSQFVHIDPDERDTLARIPAGLRFPAPGLPRGHVLLGYDERGHCPMLVDGRCSIYEDRPRTCRTYDCRVFAAAGVDPDDGDGTKAAIAAQVGRWRFGLATPVDNDRRAAVRAAATYLRAHPDVLSGPGSAPTNTRLAVAAVEAHEAFLGGEPGPDAVRVELRRRKPKKDPNRAKGPRRTGR